MIILYQAFCDHCSTIEGESELSRNWRRIIYQPYIILCTFTLVPWPGSRQHTRTLRWRRFPNSTYRRWTFTTDIVPERTFCIHKNGLPNNVCQHPCPYGNNNTASYMNSLDFSDISNYEDYMMTTSDDEELPGLEEVPYWHFWTLVYLNTYLTFNYKMHIVSHISLSLKENYFHLTITIIYIIIFIIWLSILYIPKWSGQRSILKYKTIISDHGAFPSVFVWVWHGEPGNMHP